MSHCQNIGKCNKYIITLYFWQTFEGENASTTIIFLNSSGGVVSAQLKCLRAYLKNE